MAVEIGVKGEVVTAYLSGEIDHHSAADMREIIDNAIDGNMPAVLILDFGGVSFMDSSGIALILRADKLMGQLGGSLRISGAPEQPLRVLRAAGLDRRITIE